MASERFDSEALIKKINQNLPLETRLSDYCIHNIVNGIALNVNVNNHIIAQFHAFLSVVNKTLEDQKGNGFGTK